MNAIHLVPDESDQIADAVRRLADSGEVSVVLTTGGTGVAPAGCHTGSDAGRHRAGNPRAG